MEKCHYHDELRDLVSCIKKEVAELNSNYSAMNVTLTLLVAGKIRQVEHEANRGGNHEVATKAIELAKYLAAALIGGAVAGGFF